MLFEGLFVGCAKYGLGTEKKNGWRCNKTKGRKMQRLDWERGVDGFLYSSVKGYHLVSKAHDVANKQAKWYAGIPKIQESTEKSIQVAQDRRSGIAEPHQVRGLVSGRDPGSTTKCDDERCAVLCCAVLC